MRILLIADLHIGSIKDTQYVYRVVTDIIEKEIIFNKTDIIVLLGDYFDKLFKVNEEYTSLAINIMSYIVRACQRSDTKIRMIYGTEGHEMAQYKIFNYHLTSSDVDMKIFDTVTEENISGYNILYIPEEYMDDKTKHYAEYLNPDKHYDYIFGHGIIEDGMPSIVSYSSENKKNKEKQVPRFKSGELSKVSDICIFGHYHCYTDMNNNVYYLGSLFRDSFGEEIPKGYGIIEDKSGNHDHKSEFMFVENKEAYQYITIEFPPSSEIYSNADNITTEIEKIRKQFQSVFSGDTFGKIRLKFNPPADKETIFRENLKSVLSTDKTIVPLIKESANTSQSQEMDDEEEDEWSYVLDGSLQIEDKYQKWIEMKYDKLWPIEKIKKYLSKYMPKKDVPTDEEDKKEGVD